MESFNVCTFSGNLGRDPEYAFSQAGVGYTRFSIALNTWNGKGEETTWLRCVCFGKTAEHLNDWATKGMEIFVTGKLRFKTWARDDGVKIPQFELLVESFKLPQGSGKKNGKQVEGLVTVSEASGDSGDLDTPF